MLSYLEDHRRYLTTPARYGGIDLLRCIAIGSVLIYHLNYFPIGWMGVDLFFLLSGFLIGGMILAALERNRFSFSTFYWHRALRILPLYYLAMLGYGLMRGFNHPDGVIPVFGLFHTTARYFFGTTLNPLTPDGSWSLVIEEHFYLLAPILMLLAYGAFGRRGVLALCCLAIAAGPIVRLIMTSAFVPNDGNWFFASFTQFHSRFDELAAGVLVAVVGSRFRFSVTVSIAVAVASLIALLAFVWMQIDRGMLYTPWMMTSETIWMPSFFAVMFGSWVFVLKDLSIDSVGVRVIARLSYSLYLFHFFVIISVNLHPEARDWAYDTFGVAPVQLAQLLASVVLAYLASLLVEFPFLRMYKPELACRRIEDVRANYRVRSGIHSKRSAVEGVEGNNIAVRAGGIEEQLKV